MFESFDNPNLCVVGDFNANDNNLFGDLLKNFCLDHDLIISDQDILPSNNYCSLPASVGGVKGAKNIAEMWKKHFFSLKY